ncbi:trypsin-like serine protease [Kitasatospora purpeofusca]|uniref:trypsin-like serine protease n=1 Tax=Kitasatospora purpeofusca TaxID=67352 RepID=UPI0036E4CEFE
MPPKPLSRSWRTGVLGTCVPAGAVVGDAAAEGSYAYTARLMIGDGLNACTGAVVDRNWALTAASCFSDDPAQPQTPATGAPK